MLNNLSGKKCLVLTAQAHHVAKTVSVVKELEKQGVETVYITAQNGNNEFSGDFELPLIDRNIPYIFLHDLLDAKVCEEIKSMAEDCVDLIDTTQINGEIALENYFADHGISNAIYESAENFKLFEKALNIVKPNFCLVLYEGNFWTKVFAYLCNKLNIPIFSFQEGMYTKDDMLKPAVGSTTTEYSSNVFLWGEFSKEMLSLSAPNPKKLIITGAPHTDELYQRMLSFSHADFRNNLKLTQNKQIILLILPSVLSSTETVVSTFANYVEQLGVYGIIKFRPAGNLDEFNYLKQKFSSEELMLFYQEDIYNLILGSNLVISGNSTAGLEALILKKPMVYLEDEKQDNLEEFQNVSLGTIRLKTPNEEELKILQHSLTPDEANQKLIEEYADRTVYKCDGKASERVVKKITELLTDNL